MGCELPEYLRQYYLETMDVVTWQEREHVAPTLTEPAVIDSRNVAEAMVSPRPALDTTIDDVTSIDQWLQLEQSVAACEKCETLCQSRTQTVFGVGDRLANVLIIGEAPGVDEDKQGEPFVGRSGKLLTAMLSAIKLKRQEVFITNVIKCMPTDDKDPSKLEMKNCHDYLMRQVALVRPKAILAVGRIAAQHLLATDTAIGQLRGQDHEIAGIPVIVTYHPAYLLRKPGEKRKSWQDLLRLQEMMNSWQ